MKFLQYVGILMIGALAGSVLMSDAFIFLSDLRRGIGVSNLFNWHILFYSMLASKYLLLSGIAPAVPISILLKEVGIRSIWLAVAAGVLFAMVPLALITFEFSTKSQLTHSRSEHFLIASLSLGGADATFAYIAWRFFNRSGKRAKAADAFT